MYFLPDLDQRFFLIINHLPHTALTDAIALMLSGVGSYGLVWALLGIWLFIREERKDRWFIFQFVCSAVSSFAVAELLLKPMIARPRPFTQLVTVVVGRVSDGFSFPSGHATFAFALSYVLARKEPRYTRWIYALAVAISLSRIYLGQHYPADVLAGSLLGGSIGYIVTSGSHILRSIRYGKRMEKRPS